MISRQQRGIQLPKGLIQKNGILCVQRRQKGRQMLLWLSGVNQTRIGRDLPSLRHRHIHPDILPAPIRGLAGVGAEKPQARLGLMLVSRQQNVKIQLPANPVGLIFAGVREKLSGGQIIFKPAVVNADRDVHIGLFQFFQRGRRGGESLVNLDAFQILRLLPQVDKVGGDAGNAHAQAVFQHDHGNSLHAGHTLHVGADTACVQMAEVAFQRLTAKIKIMVADGDKLVARQIHHPGGYLRALHRVPAEPVGKGASLQDIAAVQNQGVAVVGKG